ncbi:hypothetical protein CI109_101473 [Kwoniella shandongensis]|uniref:DNA 3'-5' helicase n=1 Tax=Kwoniella shandongensis TaxID=1734106 RepID=A0AAJ8MVW4_9TREE
MMGRAGRPQYDTSGVVVVMCEKSKVKKYQKMLYSQTVLESCLHESLTEYINSEIGLGTIKSLSGAQEWLRHTFFYIRIQQNPSAYAIEGLGVDANIDAWEDFLDHHVEKSLAKLRRQEFIEEVDELDSGMQLRPTNIGKIMSGCMIWASEFRDLRIRRGELATLNKIKDHPELRFPLTGTPKDYP